MTDKYQYGASVKSDYSDEWVNTYVLRPIAGVLVRILYRTPITPNQVTIAAIIAGFVAAVLFFLGGATAIALAGIAMTTKDLLDSADGQLARSKNLYSRRGRFLDSLGDVAVDAAVFSAIGWALARGTGTFLPFPVALLGFAGITLRVSYHVFYQTSYLHLDRGYEKNRIIEDITTEDKLGDPVALRLQRLFMVIYGWQDRLMQRVDEWCRGKTLSEELRHRWYGDQTGLRISGLLGFGTELLLLTVCSLLNELWLYLLLNLFLMNGILCCSVFYRRVILRRRLISSDGISEAGDSV